MVRSFVKNLSVRVHALRERWYVRPFRQWITDTRLWSLQRRGITGGFGAGLAICFVPLPVHIPLALAVAALCRFNVPVVVGTVLLVNPLTIVPVYYLAYRVGVSVLGFEPQNFHFSLSWDWLQYGLGPMWQPFVLGCALCSTFFGLSGWLTMELLWRRRVIAKYRKRRGASAP